MALEHRRTMAAEPYELQPEPEELDDADPFRHDAYWFTTGLRSGELATIRSREGELLLTYRSFANVIGIVAALVAAIVALAGMAASALLLAERAPLRAATALMLTAVFTVLIARLVPRTTVTLYDERARPALAIVQTAVFPRASFTVTEGGRTVGDLTRGQLTRLGRNRWSLLQDDRLVGEAFEEPLSAALLRKMLGKFSRRWEADVRIETGGIEAGWVRRRIDPSGQVDYLEITGGALDRRLAVALATVILGSEP